jgi:O-antigen/teichoic acid export membrane protein
MAGNGAKLIIQAAYFVTMARALGPNEYGAFVAIGGAVGVVNPFVGMGSNVLLMKHVSRDRSEFSLAWGNGLMVTVLSGVLAFAVLSMCTFVLPKGVSPLLLILISLSDLIFQRLSDLSAFAFGAFDRFRENAIINTIFQALRLMGFLCIVYVIPHPSLIQWAGVYLTASVLAGISCCIWVTARLGKPTFNVRRAVSNLKEGFYFSSGQAAQTVYNDIDKTMLGRLSDLSATGIYGAAYRLIDVSLVPIRSLVSAAYPGTFRAGRNGITGSIAYMKKMLLRALLYAIFATVTILVLAPVVPHVLGGEYSRTVEALRWLAILPILKAFQFFLADALTGSGHQGLRTLLQVVTAIFNILVNLWVIRAYSWRGAAWSSIMSDLFLTLLLIAAIFLIKRTELDERTLKGDTITSVS